MLSLKNKNYSLKSRCYLSKSPESKSYDEPKKMGAYFIRLTTTMKNNKVRTHNFENQIYLLRSHLQCLKVTMCL